MKLKSPPDIEYPESDGKPMAETDEHRDWMFCIIERLRRRYSGKRVYVSGNLFIYYEKGDRTKVVAPDVFVVLKCEPHNRRIFKTWEEGKGPDFILETTSRSTRREDTGEKKLIFAQLGVKEYFLYDPLAEWLDPPLQGFRLKNGVFERIPEEPDGSIISKVLNVRFVLEDDELVMFDLRTGERVLSEAEDAEKQKVEAERKWIQTEQERVELERRWIETERLRVETEQERVELERKWVEMERLRVETEQARIETERKRMEAEQKAAEAEKQGAEVNRKLLRAEASLEEEKAARERLEEELARLRRKSGPGRNGGAKNGQ